eukprot:TRINITY_DN4383_c0_g1_i2.p1 TRINITY_DN4383_c0_g1~~TRINITY_DN4383_c0_g1_i2.p1  ORF type:complete len:379 (-),score=87.84 TRINITY_DN4383_c0_g1_i2:110-1246(-)
MGATVSAPCCSNADGLPVTQITMLDPLRPDHACSEAVKDMQIPALAIETLAPCPEEKREDIIVAMPGQWTLAKAMAETSPDLLAAVRRDDGPGVLQYVADGTDFVEMGEALRIAAHRGSASVVRELVAVGLTVNDACPHTGYTPLQLAAASGHLLVCELLLDALADVHRRIGGDQGATALSLARKMGNPEVEEVIEQHIARQLVLEQGHGDVPESPSQTRLHVLPRVSHGLSEVMLKNIKPPPGKYKPALESVREALHGDNPTAMPAPGAAFSHGGGLGSSQGGAGLLSADAASMLLGLGGGDLSRSAAGARPCRGSPESLASNTDDAALALFEFGPDCPRGVPESPGPREDDDAMELLITPTGQEPATLLQSLQVAL